MGTLSPSCSLRPLPADQTPVTAASPVMTPPRAEAQGDGMACPSSPVRWGRSPRGGGGQTSRQSRPREVLSLYTPARRQLPFRGFSAQRSDPLPRVRRRIVPKPRGAGTEAHLPSALRVARARQSCGYLKSQRDREGTVGVRRCPTPGVGLAGVAGAASASSVQGFSGNDPASVVRLGGCPAGYVSGQVSAAGAGRSRHRWDPGEVGCSQHRAHTRPVTQRSLWTAWPMGVHTVLGWDCHCLPGFHIAGGQGSNIRTSVPCPCLITQ